LARPTYSARKPDAERRSGISALGTGRAFVLTPNLERRNSMLPTAPRLPANPQLRRACELAAWLGLAWLGLAWLIARYRETPAWTTFSLATRRQRENVFRQVIESAGQVPYSEITAATIAAGRDRR